MSDIQLDHLGLTAEMRSSLPVEDARQFAQTLDHPWTEGVLPITWHWSSFVPEAATSGLGVDGHPPRPPGELTATYPRRMFAGGRLRSHGGLASGRTVLRTTELVSAEEKKGRSGGLLLVTVRHHYEQGGSLALEEEQDLVYLPANSEAIPLPEPDGEPRKGTWTRTLQPTRPLLFRFSAATWNAHRIHYDREYAQREEGYPDLVVHGPLTATLLVGLASEALGRAPASFRFRARAPLFVDQPITLVGEPDEDRIRLEAVRVDGVTAMTAEAH